MNGTEPSNFPGFRFVPRTGVIYVMHEAMARGFTYDDPHWANLGQGSPETGPIPEAPPRIETVTIAGPHQQYAPVAGNKDLCQAVADFYNAVYRRDKKSPRRPHAVHAPVQTIALLDRERSPRALDIVLPRAGIAEDVEHALTHHPVTGESLDTRGAEDASRIVALCRELGDDQSVHRRDDIPLIGVGDDGAPGRGDGTTAVALRLQNRAVGAPSTREGGVHGNCRAQIRFRAVAQKR